MFRLASQRGGCWGPTSARCALMPCARTFDPALITADWRAALAIVAIFVYRVCTKESRVESNTV